MSGRLNGGCRAALVIAVAAITGPGFAQSKGRAPVATPIAHQVALDRAGYSPGVIDGRIGPKTRLALREFQQAHGLGATGEFDQAARRALGVGTFQAVRRYTVTAADLDAVGPVPSDWNAKARLTRLKYESLAALLAERGHCSKALVAQLNPGVSLSRLRPGDTVRLPNVSGSLSGRAVAALDVNLDQKVVRARDAAGRTVALFHCSIAKLGRKRPSGTSRVTRIAFEPTYLFRPEMWPEVRNVTRRLTIPPGPRNPVGLCWIGLSLPGFGIHGTPNPELVGKTGSHGCIRLANWDAQRLGRLMRVGTPVHFSGHK